VAHDRTHWTDSQRGLLIFGMHRTMTWYVPVHWLSSKTVFIYYGRMIDCRWVSYSCLTYDHQRLSRFPWWGLTLVSNLVSNVMDKPEVAYTTYRNAVRGGSSYGRRQRARKFGEVWPYGFRDTRVDRQTDKQLFVCPLHIHFHSFIVHETDRV